MPANYPNSIVDLITPDGSKPLGEISQLHSLLHIQDRLEIIALETELGLGLKGSLTNLAERINVSLNLDGSLKAEGYTLESLSDVTVLSGLVDKQLLMYDLGDNIWRNASISEIFTETDPLSLHLDQTTPQTIINGQPIWDTLTALQIVVTDANKKLQSLPVATYPSLTELSYVKGLTSAAQTQITARALAGANSDITSLTGLTTPLSIAQGGTANTQGSGQINTNRFMIDATDFLLVSTQGAFPTWLGAGFGTTAGTLSAAAAGEVNHPGIARLVSSVAANSGYKFTTGATPILLAGGETTELIFRLISETVTTCKFGFQDVYTISAPVDGAWINIASTILDGRTSNNSTSSTTGTTYTLTTNTWYRAKITINSNATLVTYELYSEAGALLWTNTLSTNIPTTTGRETGHAVLATDAGTTATALVDVDFMNIFIDRNLTR